MHRLSSVILILSLACVLPAPSLGQADEYAFTIARIKYDGGGDWYSDPESLPQLLAFVRENTLLDVAPREDIVELTSDRIYSYPYVYLTGHGNIRLQADEALLLRRYLEGGGFLHVDDNYGLDEHLRREMRKVFPDREFVELPFNHEIYHTQYEFPNGLPKIHEHDGGPPQGFALLDDDGRVMVFYTHQTDLGDGWEPASVHENPEDMRLAALRMGANILTYAMTN
ncbi:MAG: DUF4159 domain-containing protein [Rhodothermales bacterium]|nr:DUF4159 domain-containing protein [Rhodothermales bacterium]